MELEDYLYRQMAWSGVAFGPGDRTKGVLDHIAKEMDEVLKDPHDIEEWVDIMILAFDGAMRNGYTPRAICLALESKLKKNKLRKWPAWKDQDPDKAVEHIK